MKAFKDGEAQRGMARIIVKNKFKRWIKQHHLAQKLKYLEGILDYLRCKQAMLRFRKFRRFCDENHRVIAYNSQPHLMY